MDLQGERTIPAPVERTWAALNDPEILKACIQGCESLERTGEDQFDAAIAVKVGPVSARFKAKLRLSDVKPPQSYTIHFDGQGGMAGHGKGSADVSLAPVPEGTKLSYTAKAQVGGKLAQVGSRLIDAAAGKITEDFFSAFEKQVAPPAAEPTASAVTAAETPEADKGKTLWWIIGGIVVVAVAYFATR
jgi:hypothetical protein